MSIALTLPRIPRRDFGDGPEGDQKYATNVLIVVSIGTVLTALNGGLLNISLPVVVRHFDATAVEASWLLLAAMLTSTSLIIMFGRLADMFGRRRMYMGGLATMIVSSLAAGFAPDVITLTILRMVQAAGQAVLLANMAAILTLAYPKNRLGKVMGIYMSALAGATLAGPPIGAVLAATLGWRWIFWFNVPVGLLAYYWTARTLRDMPPIGERGRLDIPGVVLIATTLSGLILALSTIQEAGWADPVVVGGLVVFAISLPLFIAIEGRLRSPLIDLALFKRPAFALANMAMFFGNMSRFALVLIAGLYFQALEGDGPVSAALKVLPLPIANTIAGLTMGRIGRWGSTRAIATGSTALSGVGLALLVYAFAAGSPYWVFAVGFIIVGWGGGIFMPSNTLAILEDVPVNRLGVVNAVRMMLMSSGGLIATAIALALVTSTLSLELRQAVFAGTVSQLGGSAVNDLHDGYLRGMIALLLLALIGLAACIASQRAAGRELRPRHADLTDIGERTESAVIGDGRHAMAE